MRLIDLECLPRGMAMINPEHIVSVLTNDQDETRIHLSNGQHLDVPHSYNDLRNVLAGRDTDDDGDGPIGFLP